jgi:hypothetical protein
MGNGWSIGVAASVCGDDHQCANDAEGDAFADEPGLAECHNLRVHRILQVADEAAPDPAVDRADGQYQEDDADDDDEYPEDVFLGGRRGVLGSPAVAGSVPGEGDASRCPCCRSRRS